LRESRNIQWSLKTKPGFPSPLWGRGPTSGSGADAGPSVRGGGQADTQDSHSKASGIDFPPPLLRGRCPAELRSSDDGRRGRTPRKILWSLAVLISPSPRGRGLGGGGKRKYNVPTPPIST